MRTPSILVRTSVAVLAIVLAGCGTSASPSPSGAASASASASASPSGGSASPSGSAPASSAAASPSGEPIVVGSTLSLTGPFAATGKIHELAGNMFIERLNAAGGLLGRPVEWTVLDDESVTDNVGPLYERLISQDQVDLIMGPYATPNILAAMAIAERNSMVLPQHTSVLAPAMNYDCQFPAWSIGPDPNVFIPNLLFDGVATLPDPPQSVAIVTVQNGSALFIKEGSPDDASDPGMASIAEDKGLEVVLDVAYPPGTTDFGSLATQIRDAAPDLLVSLSLGVDTVGQIQALKQLNVDVPLIFSLFPAPGPLQGLGADGEGVLSVSIFEPSDKSLAAVGEEGASIVEEFQTEAAAAQLYPVFETQAAASWNAWEILVAGVEAAGTVDDHEAICDALHESGAQTTFSGQLTFDPEDNNFWPTTLGLKQIQDGEWVMVYPEASAAAPIQGPEN